MSKVNKMSEVNIEKCVLKSDYGIKNLNDIKTVIEYVMSEVFLEDYDEKFKIEGLKISDEDKQFWLGVYKPSFWIKCFNTEYKEEQLIMISELFVDWPIKWSCEIVPFLHVSVSKDDWTKIREEFVKRWNAYWKGKQEKECIENKDKERLVSVGFEDFLRVL